MSIDNKFLEHEKLSEKDFWHGKSTLINAAMLIVKVREGIKKVTLKKLLSDVEAIQSSFSGLEYKQKSSDKYYYLRSKIKELAKYIEEAI